MMSDGDARAALPALSRFGFPTALVVTQGGEVIARAGAVDEVFPLASVTKPLVAWSALVAVERGMLRLEDLATPERDGAVLLAGATVADLLSHSSGVAFDSDAVIAPAGRRRAYSNRGIEILAERLEETTGTGLQEWVEQTVLEPLGMASVLIPGSPAHSGQGSAEDLSLFARELAAPALVGEQLARRARTVARPGLDGVLPGYGRQSPCDFGLGLEIRGHKSPHWTGAANSPQTFGHFGQAGSFLWVDPVAGREAVFLGAQPFSRLHIQVWPSLCDQVLAL